MTQRLKSERGRVQAGPLRARVVLAYQPRLMLRHRLAAALGRPDPLLAIWLIVLAFFLLGLIRLGIPSRPMFDEIHYLPAARRLIDLTRRLNPEHPLLGKEFIALGMKLVGDTPFGWRLPNLVAGTLGLFGATRAVWWASRSRVTTLLFGVFLATNFQWFILSRIAMLDMAMLSMMALAFWQWSLAWAKGRRWHLLLAGVFMGLSLGGKWNVIPLMVTPGLLFAWDRARAVGLVHHTPGRKVTGATLAEWLFGTRYAPVRGVSLIEAVVWLGLVPVLTYFATFAPAFFYQVQPMTLRGLIPWQTYMLHLQDSVVKPHRYMSRWWQWMFNLRPIWFLYAPVDGAQRGILMVGHPFTMLAGLPALLLCAWEGWRGDGARPRLKQGVALLYVLSLVFWAINGKPVQFYYHYALAAVFVMAALALVLGEWWEQGLRWPLRASMALTLAIFVGFYPIISAAPLPTMKAAYRTWMWLHSWQ
ncbi:glycosyltransferase family 39 protein [Novosphingobium sp.]|uniref:glycosyltransferase family 39 protein n=1 Tax=Novosphingobium sp. TaxID=1874826 RepID=UPI0038BB71D1